MISIVYDVRRYRSLLAEAVREGDFVIEIGPHTGKSTLGYIEKAGKIILVDKGRDCEKDLRLFADSHEKVSFACADARGFEAVKEVLKETRKCDVFAVDMGGGRHVDTVFKVWATWSGIFKPRDSVIRNRELVEFLSRANIVDDSVKKEFDDDGWLATWGRETPYQLRKQLEEFSYWIDIDKPLD